VIIASISGELYLAKLAIADWRDIMENNIREFIATKFGLGGIANYTWQQRDNVWKLFEIFYSSEFGDAERHSLVKFLQKMERDDNSYRERVNEAMREISQKEIGL
jgi:hypothetical protein